MTQSIRDAAQALLDALDNYHLHGSQVGGQRRKDRLRAAATSVRAALSAPQPTADGRVAEHMKHVDATISAATVGGQDLGRQQAGGHHVFTGLHHVDAVCKSRLLIEQSARALLSASQEDAEHAAMYRWMKQHVRTGSIGFGDWWIDACGDDWDEQIRSAMKEKKA